MTSDHEGDIEIEFEACRCSLPRVAADAARQGFQNHGLRVTSERVAGDREVLVAKRVVRFELKGPRASAAGLFSPGARFSTLELVDDVQITEAQLAPLLKVAVAGFTVPPFPAPKRGSKPAWMPVFDLQTWTRTGVELFVRDDHDADAQLGAVAPALGVMREQIEVKPPPGWNGYGHPALFST